MNKINTKTKFLIYIGVIFALVIGFMIGIRVDYPKIDSNYAAGTIGKIKNYRNIKLSDADLKFHNDRISDTAKVRQIKNYYNFHYLNALRLSVNIGNAIKEANLVSAFKAKNQATIDNLAEYEAFLTSARTDLLMGLSAVNTVKEIEPSLFMLLTNQANNVVIQMNYRNKFVIRFIDDVVAYVKENPSADCAGLKKFHDLLTINEVFNSAMTRDKVLIKYFDKKPLLGSKVDLQLNDQSQVDIFLQNDIKALIYNKGGDKKGLLLVCSSETLNSAIIEVNSLNKIFNSEELRVWNTLDSEKLSTGFGPDAETLEYLPV